MTDDQRIIVELEHYKETTIKLEKKIEDLEREVNQLSIRYLDAFNKILEAQSENRTNEKQILNEINALKEKSIIMDLTINKLQNIDAYSEIKRFIEHAKNEKEITNFITNTRDFITSIQTRIMILTGGAVAMATALLAMLFGFLTKLFGGG
jgi:predicted RNase H-like nuclease (RuvC/YqgF family)